MIMNDYKYDHENFHFSTGPPISSDISGLARPEISDAMGIPVEK